MRSRVIWFLVAAFWVAMNVLLWRVEYGTHGSGVPVPADLVWKKIMTAPDASSLNIYQNGKRTGFCEFSTSVETEMAKLDDNSPPPEGLAARAGYQIRLNGNASLSEFTNRLSFDVRLKFSEDRHWHELALKVSSHYGSVEINSLAAARTVHLKITGDIGPFERDLTFDALRDPRALLDMFAGESGGFGLSQLPFLPLAAPGAAPELRWEAHRARLQVGPEPVSAYRLETRLLDYPVVFYVSTLGEILRVELPGNLVATLDGWNNL